MSTQKKIDGHALGTMALLCLIWGVQQTGLKATSLDASPILQIAIRSGIAAILVSALMLSRGEKIISSPATWPAGVGAGILFSLQYLLLGAGLGLTTSSHGILFLYVGPLLAAMGVHFCVRTERMLPAQWMGVLTALAGFVIALCTSSTGHPVDSGSTLLGDTLCILAGATWGATTVLVRCSRLAQASVSQISICQLGMAFASLGIASFVLDQWSFEPTPLLVANLAFQSIIVSSLSLLAWLTLLRRYPASGLGPFIYLTPLFGIMLGTWVLDEAISAGFILGAIFVGVGIAIVHGYDWFQLRIALIKRRPL